MSMKVMFFGANEIGEISLEILLKNKIKICRVVVPENNRTTKIFNICRVNNIEISKYDKNVEEIKKKVLRIKPDLIVVSSFPKILPSGILTFPKFGAINIHPSLLPKYRGPHPMHWALLNDEKETGVTVHFMTDVIDGGNIIVQRKVEIENTDDINIIIKKLTTIGAYLVLEVIDSMNKKGKKMRGARQKSKDVSLARKRIPEEGKIDWSDNSRLIFNLVRALKSPYPNAFAFNAKKEKVEFEKSYICSEKGKVLGKYGKYYFISSGDGVVCLKTKKRLKIGEVLS